jgi:hypothetical protein
MSTHSFSLKGLKEGERVVLERREDRGRLGKEKGGQGGRAGESNGGISRGIPMWHFVNQIECGTTRGSNLLYLLFMSIMLIHV